MGALAILTFAALPARSARRPRYGGTLRVEIGAAVASLDPQVVAATAEEAAAKLQVDSLIYDHRDPEGQFTGAPGSGPFRVTAFEPGKRATLAANDEFREGRPFVDAIEITMGRPARERLVDLQLNKSDFAEVAPQDARRAAEQGVRVSVSQPDELLALIVAPTAAKLGTPGAAAVSMSGEALSRAIDRVAIVNFILQKTGEPAGGLLPQWSSGTAFLFPTASPSASDVDHAKELWQEIAPSAPLVLGYDSADSLAQSVAERIVVNAKEAGMSLRAQGIPMDGAANLRAADFRSARVDVELVRWRMTSPSPGDALREFLKWIYAGPLAGAGPAALPESPSPEENYLEQRAVLSTYRVVPMVWLPQVYGLSARVRDWKAPGPGENWPLADVWLDGDAPNRVPSGGAQ